MTAGEVLDKMLAVYHQAESYADRASYVLETVRRSEGVQREIVLFDFSLAWQRPDKIRFHYRRAYPSSQQLVTIDVASNGELVRSLAGELPDQVLETAAPDELTAENFIPEPSMRKTVLQVSLENIYPQLLMLLGSGDLASVFPEDRKPHMLEREKLHDRVCHRVVLESEAGQRILWIDAENFLLRRMELPVTAQLSSLDPDKEFNHYAVWIDFQDATVRAEISEQVFTLNIPEGARRMRRLVFPPPPPPLAILGKPVAEFSFDTLEGEDITPSTLAGKVVLMEFWSTTCPPCRQHTPLLEQVYQELKDEEGFLFYAVNANLKGTSNETVSRVFKDWGGTIPLLRDLRETSYTELDIEAYPHTILINREGRLQLYEPGMHTRAEPLLAAVHKVLDDEDLAGAARDAHAEKVEKYKQDLQDATIEFPAETGATEATTQSSTEE